MPDKAPNAPLRAWRNASRLTRVEMAEKINATKTGIAEALACDAERVRRWETGDVRWPSTVYRLALTQLTGKTPEDLGFIRAQHDEIRQAPQGTAELSQTSTTTTNGNSPSRADEIETRLATDENITAALVWLDQQAARPAGNSRRQVANRLVDLDPRHLRDRAQLRGRIGRDQIAQALVAYYSGAADAGLSTYRIGTNGDLVATSLLTTREWLDLGFPLNTSHPDFSLTNATGPQLPMDELRFDAAVECLAEALITNRRIVNAPLYRMTNIDIGPGQINAGFAMSEFVHYALSMDLLERELLDAIVDRRPIRPGTLPLRDHYLPDIDSITRPGERLCAGGPLALCAIARPGTRARQGRPDYVILVQERSGNVLNAAQKLAVIPKAFHEPLADFGEDVSIASTLEREMEEELFGRNDVDSTFGGQLHADPMHPSRLSAPMAWLMERPDQWRLECTGFGFNLVSGNFEFASLIVIDNEEWWTRFGGHIAANWESSGMRRYSTLDTDLISSLLRDSAWSNEGLFALSEGLQRLSQIGGSRVNLPTIKVEL
ncbi:transcriptional regulator [Nonomuraea lactucae]|uniref:transcriptional regulator n=1 Tax=Nonomuraea lactucae TaxID=2249762 RepID=UPI000DE3D667|nr:transcriptional regulator [Nonomuraea lactucae]